MSDMMQVDPRVVGQQNMTIHGHGNETVFTACIPATAQNVRSLLFQIRQRLTEKGISEDTCGVSEIVLAEALNNIVEHAFFGHDAGALQVDILFADNQLHFELCDHGNPIPAQRVPPERLPFTDNRLEDLPEGGFGWFMIHRLTSALSYERVNNVNRLSFVVETI